MLRSHRISAVPGKAGHRRIFRPDLEAYIGGPRLSADNPVRPVGAVWMIGCTQADYARLVELSAVPVGVSDPFTAGWHAAAGGLVGLVIDADLYGWTDTVRLAGTAAVLSSRVRVVVAAECRPENVPAGLPPSVRVIVRPDEWAAAVAFFGVTKPKPVQE